MPREGKIKRVYHNNIQGISSPGIKRLLHRAGVKRVSKRVYAEVRGILQVKLEKVLKHSVALVEHDRKKTLMMKHVEAAADLSKVSLVAGVPKKGAAKAKITKKCANGGGAPGGGAHKKADGSFVMGRHKPGVVALGMIRFAQKHSDCLSLRKLPFVRLCRELIQNMKDDLRLSKQAVLLLQILIEDQLVKLFQNANLVAIAAKRKSLKTSDIQTAHKIMGGRH